MRSIGLCLVSFLAMGSCTPRTPWSFNEGPPRMRCQADTIVARVDKPWLWSCTLAGDLSPFAQTLIGLEITTQNREAWPQRSIVGEGLKRVYPYESTFDTQFYLELTGNVRLGPDDHQVEILRPGNPTAPPEPIEGVEASLDGSFWLKVQLFEVMEIDPATKHASVKFLTGGRVNGKLQCPQCMV